MLIYILLPASLGDAGNFAPHRHFAQFLTAQTELAEDAARTPRHGAAVALARRVGVAGQLLQAVRLVSAMMAFNAVRLAAYLAASWARFTSRLIKESFATSSPL